VKDQELNPRPHTPRPAALPVKVEQWVGDVQNLQKDVFHSGNMLEPKLHGMISGGVRGQEACLVVAGLLHEAGQDGV